MSWLRRLSRDRSSKVDSHDISAPSRPYNQQALDSPTTGGQPFKDTQYSSDFNSQDRLQHSYRPNTAGDPDYVHVPVPQSGKSQAANAKTSASGGDSNMNRGAFEPAPDPLTKAFNEALRPYQDQLDDLRAEIDEKQYQIEKLEDERADMHAWIDKRGLRADVPASIARSMNTDATSAATLSYQLDRKMTVLNHDLHRLQDSLTSHLPTSTFATTLGALIVPIEELASLPGGPPLAYELVIKLGGNLNSHNGDEGWNNEADAASRADFYARLDEVMLEIVRARLDTEGLGRDSVTGGSGQQRASGSSGAKSGEWSVSGQILRLEKTGTFLKNKLGLQSYFPATVDMMKRAETAGRGGTGGAGGGAGSGIN